MSSGERFAIAWLIVWTLIIGLVVLIIWVKVRKAKHKPYTGVPQKVRPEFEDFDIDYNHVAITPDPDMPKFELKTPVSFIDALAPVIRHANDERNREEPTINERRLAAGFPTHHPHRHFQLFAGRTYDRVLGPSYVFVCRDADCPTEWKASIKAMWGFVPAISLTDLYYWRNRAEFIRHMYTPLRPTYPREFGWQPIPKDPEEFNRRFHFSD